MLRDFKNSHLLQQVQPGILLRSLLRLKAVTVAFLISRSTSSKAKCMSQTQSYTYVDTVSHTDGHKQGAASSSSRIQESHQTEAQPAESPSPLGLAEAEEH